MSESLHHQATRLLEQAVEVYGDDPAGLELTRHYQRRLQEPVRIAVAGMVKAGKSTLINAIIGEQIAPTDAGESTRVVTWYRYALTPRISVHFIDGSSADLPIRRAGGALVLDVEGRTSHEIDRIVVDWPSPNLHDFTVIDTPGIASLSTDVSAKSLDFLTPADRPSEADAIIYLMRHLHASDLNFLRAFKDTTAGRSATINALAVLSRADEIGAGRIDSLLSAQKIASRYRNEGLLGESALEIVPLAGLLAQSSRTLRNSEYLALKGLTALDPDEQSRLLLSADRFVRPEPGIPVTQAERAALLDRFGLFGTRLALTLLRTKDHTATTLAHELTRRSGFDDLLTLVRVQFRARADHLRARTAVLAITKLIQQRPRTGTAHLNLLLDQMSANDHESRELRLLADLRTRAVVLPDGWRTDAERLLGSEGLEAAVRLGRVQEASRESLVEAGTEALSRWRTEAHSPFISRELAEAYRILARACESLIHSLRTDSSPAG